MLALRILLIGWHGHLEGENCFNGWDTLEKVLDFSESFPHLMLDFSIEFLHSGMEVAFMIFPQPLPGKEVKIV